MILKINSFELTNRKIIARIKIGEKEMSNEEINMEKIIDEIFRERVEKMQKTFLFDETITDLERQKLNEKEIQFRTAVNNIPTALKHTRRSIVDSFIEYIDILNTNNKKYYEKYYKQGVIDGIQLINGVLKR